MTRDSQNVTAINWLGGNSEMISNNFDEMLKKKPDFLTVYAGTNDLAMILWYSWWSS